MLNPQQQSMINQLYNPKFLATRDKEGRANLVIVTSFEFFENQLVMGNIFFWKTAKNLQENPQLSLLVMDQKLRYFTITGRFAGFQETGELLDHLNRNEMVRYNAYTGFRSAGLIEIESVSAVAQISLWKMVGGYLKGKMTGGAEPCFPRAVAEKFAVLKSLKAAAYVQENKLHVMPLPAVKVDGDYLIPAAKLPAGLQCAANVITPQVVSFQVKGTTDGKGLKVEEVYAAGLPVPGKLIYQGA